MARPADNTQPWFPITGHVTDGYSNEDEASATCFCGAVQLAFPLKAPGFLGSFVCNCSDCRKITAYMFASNFIVKKAYLRHVRGEENLKTFSMQRSIASQNTMTNYFCNTCGSLMYRISSAAPDGVAARLGSVDDFNLAETKMKPLVEQFTTTRVAWHDGVQGEDVQKFEDSPYFPKHPDFGK
ncbi:hypothetical protein S40288_10423 [Stachybotrys chartarum IBT 40288]|nr:hypothetical protein S40288_10423 [Stachybotrys chartarum IBT 40288]